MQLPHLQMIIRICDMKSVRLKGLLWGLLAQSIIYRVYTQAELLHEPVVGPSITTASSLICAKKYLYVVVALLT